jgi:hypothetical protein
VTNYTPSGGQEKRGRNEEKAEEELSNEWKSGGVGEGNVYGERKRGEGERKKEEEEGKEGHTLLPKGFKPALILSPPTKAVQSI